VPVVVLEPSCAAVFRSDAAELPGSDQARFSRTLQRAVVFMDEHAREDISVADIAAAACVSTRAVQLAFRRYLGITPLSYLRQVRLEQAHRELLAAHPAQGTVSRIAADWQFTSLSRFTALYRATYGFLPSHALQHGTAGGGVGRLPDQPAPRAAASPPGSTHDLGNR